ncbi:MAG: hypothetical protein R2838_04715 [Caldilineaceae bacterium]
MGHRRGRGAAGGGRFIGGGRVPDPGAARRRRQLPSHSSGHSCARSAQRAQPGLERGRGALWWLDLVFGTLALLGLGWSLRSDAVLRQGG